MTQDITVIRSNCYTKDDFPYNTIWTNIYDLTISCASGTVYYSVRTLKNEISFERMDSLIETSNPQNLDFSEVDIRIREHFIKTVNPNISQKDFITVLYGPTNVDFLNDKKHFVYSLDITFQLLEELGPFEKVISHEPMSEISRRKISEEHHLFEIDEKWLVTVVVKNGLFNPYAFILNISKIEQ